MRLTTIQHRDILDIIERDGLYRADYDLINWSEYEEQYRMLGQWCGFDSCRIFCAPENNENSVYASNIREDSEHVKLELEVEDERCVFTSYYDWSDYLYYSSGQEYDEYFSYDAEQAIENIDSYIKATSPESGDQILIEAIYAEDLI